MRSSASHFALDTPPPIRYRVSSAAGSLALIDSKTQTRTILFSAKTGNRHGFKWCGVDACDLADWLNARELGYPKPVTIEAYPYDRD
jgi:hypothetical protein